jgi:hypothetical protein
MTYAHSSVLLAFCFFGLYPLILTSHKSLFISFSSHLEPALPLCSLQLTFKKCLKHLCLIHCNRMSQPYQPFWFNICFQIRGLIKFSYGLLINLINLWSVTGHYTFLKIFLSHVFNILLIEYKRLWSIDLLHANSHLATQEIHHLSQVPKIHYSAQNSMLTQYLCQEEQGLKECDTYI